VPCDEVRRRVAGDGYRSWVARFSLALVLLFAASAPQAVTPGALRADIPPQPLRSALADWAQQTALQIIYLADVVQDQQSPGASAGLAARDALTQLLAGTGLRFEFITPRAARISAAPRAPPSNGTPAKATPPDRPATTSEEVVVTGMRMRGEFQNVPVSVVVLKARDLEAAHIDDAVRLADLTPGVEFDSYLDYGAGVETNLSIRGVNSRDGSTVAIYLDDIPIPTDRASIFGRAYPLLFDLDHVEILRGPQGTLLGEGAEGGALRFVRPEPSASAFTGLAHVDYSATLHGSPSYEFGGDLGGPLLPERIGFRLSAWSRQDGGYIDRVDPYTTAPLELDTNSAQRDAFSGAVLFKLGSDFSITPAFDYQSVDINDSSAFFTFLSSPGDGVLRSGKYLSQPYFDRYRLPSLKIVGELGSARLVAESGFLDRWAYAFIDTTNNGTTSGPCNLVPGGPLLPLCLGSAATAHGVSLSLEQRVLSQLIRIESTDPAARVRWLAGAQYLHAHYDGVQDLVNEALSEGGEVDGRLYSNLNTLQVAAFAQADVRLPKGFGVTAGVRTERMSYDSFSQILARALGPPISFSAHDERTEVAPHLALNYQPDARHLYYVSAAKGYRMGGANLPLGLECGSTPTPATYAPDSVWSYELGAKTSTASGRLQTDVSIFHAVWRDMQLQIPYRSCGFGYTSNVGAAASDGFDLGVDAALTSHLNLRVLAAYADARYTQTVLFDGHPLVSAGDALGAVPLVPAPFTASAIATYTTAIDDSIVSLRAQDVFHSRNHGPFNTDNPDGVVYAPARQADPPTNQLDLSVGVSRRTIEVSTFLLNAFNAQPTLQLRNRTPTDTLLYAATLRPRTLGIAVNWRPQ
jgi:iron complex outermembrane recepter protein